MFCLKHPKLVSVVGGVLVTGILFSSLLLLSRIQVQAQSAGLDALQANLDFLRSNAEATLLFNPFGTNPDSRFIKHHLTEDQIRYLCRQAPCTGMGVNTASEFTELRADRPYAAAERLGMEYILEIASSSNAGNAANRIEEESGIFQAIVRFGAGDGRGLSNVSSVINWLSSVGNNVGGTEFYAIAGPNEPDLETWWQNSTSFCGNDRLADPSAWGSCNCGPYIPSASPENRANWAQCTGTKLAEFSNAICAAKAEGTIPPHVKLLTPAFNLTSSSFPELYAAYVGAGARMDCFDGFAGNLYPTGGTVADYWAAQDLESIGLPIFITETGPWEGIPDDGTLLGDSGDNDEITRSIYVSPILGVFPPTPRDVGEIRDSLINQGYQAYCATPTYTVVPKVEGAVDLFLDNIRAGYYSGATLNVGSTQIIDYRQADTPIFRDTDRKRRLKADLEEYFGYKQTGDSANYGQAEIQSAAVNSLLSDLQKCYQAASDLEVQQTMCNKLSEPDECALYASTVPGTEYTIETLIEDYTSFAGDSRDKMEVCKRIVVGEGGDELRAGMVNASTHIERASRIAFLVMAVVQKPVVDNMLFNFFSFSEQAEPRHEVLMVAFKIPDIGTNKGSVWESEPVTNGAGEELYTQVRRDNAGMKVEQVESGHTYWDDAMTLTRNLLIPRKMAERLDLDGTTYREELREEAVTATNQTDDSLIHCLNGQAPLGQGSPACNDEVVKAVVDIINATWTYDKERVSCDNLSIDEVEEIGEPAKVDRAGVTTYFIGDYGDYILDNIWDTDATGESFTSNMKVNLQTWPTKPCVPLEQGRGAEGDCTTLNYYLVYPMGYDLETLEYVMARTFLTAEQFESYTDNPYIKERFNIFGDQVELTSETDEYRYIDRLHCTTNRYGEVECPEEEFEGSVSSDQGPALFFGGRLGFWVREIQKVFNRLDSLSYAYLTKCTSTEQFLLDQCGGDPGDRTYSVDNFCNSEKSGKIERDVDNTELSRFKFFQSNPSDPDDESQTIPDEENSFFPKEGELGCTFRMSARSVDSLSLILSGGQDILANNPGNILGCVGMQSAASKVRIRRLPPDAGPGALDSNSPLWDNAEVMRTTGGSATQIEYDLRVTPGYYRLEAKIKQNSICLSDTTWVMDNRATVVRNGEVVENTGNYPYRFITKDRAGFVIDLTDSLSCSEGACVNYNFQSAMEGGGPVMGRDDEGNSVVLYTIDLANEYVKDNQGCELSFDYSTLQWNNTCGGGRKHDCEDEGGDCNFWQNFISKLNNGSADDLWLQGYEAYKSVYGRTLRDPGGEFNCTHGDGVFSNTISLYSCDSYTSSLDSLRLFGKVVGFQIEWWDGGIPIQMPLPPKPLWDEMVKAEEKYGCDKWLLLAIASSESPLGEYLNDNQPNDADAQGFFSFTGEIWNFWKTPDAHEINQCLKVQPEQFNPSSYGSYSDRHDIAAQVDQACRISLYSGMQKYPEDLEAFRKAFFATADPDENTYNLGWTNIDSAQANYVFEFWKKARESAEDPAKAQPAQWPPELCPAGTEIPRRSSTPIMPRDGDIGAWKEFVHYDQSTSLPSRGVATYYNPPLMNEVLGNRTNLWNQIAGGLVNNCELIDLAGGAAQRWATAQQAARTNGSTRAVGCAAMFRLGDVPFMQDGGPNAVRTVWLKVDNGPLAGTPIGPITVIDVIAEQHIEQRYKQDNGRWIIDLDYYTFRMLYDHNAAWNGPQEITVCDTQSECQ